MSSTLEAKLLAQAWTELTSDPSGRSSPPASLEVTGGSGYLASPFPVMPVAVACVGSALQAAAALRDQWNGSVTHVSVDRGHVAAAVRSERYFERGGVSAGAGFAALSRFWPTADGWVRTHANYPWHREALLQALATTGDADAVAAAIGALAGDEVEERVFAAGGIAAAVRTRTTWQAHPQGRAVAGEPLISHHVAGDASPRARRPDGLVGSGVRVLDLTRVIAGPVCTRFLGALGAEVLRLDPPDHPDLGRAAVADTLLGKRSCLVDLGAPAGPATLHGLLGQADVVVCGYRPGALDRFGLTAEALAERHPGIVVVYLDAWGHCGPWAHRRGFDSVVQAPTGIAARESAAGGQPGALPCQLLDHGTGYLAAAAVLDGLRRQREHGGTHVRRLSLARTAWWLTSAAADADASPEPVVDDGDGARWLVAMASVAGPVTAVGPPGSVGHRPLQWPSPLTGYGNDRPAWISAGAPR